MDSTTPRNRTYKIQVVIEDTVILAYTSQPFCLLILHHHSTRFAVVQVRVTYWADQSSAVVQELGIIIRVDTH